jgi:hypothetical protein
MPLPRCRLVYSVSAVEFFSLSSKSGGEFLAGSIASAVMLLVVYPSSIVAIGLGDSVYRYIALSEPLG